MQKNYSLPCTGVYRPLGGVRANVAFNAGSKTWACGGDPQPDGPSSSALHPRETLLVQSPLKFAKCSCSVFYGRSPTDTGEGLGALDWDTYRPVLGWQTVRTKAPSPGHAVAEGLQRGVPASQWPQEGFLKEVGSGEASRTPFFPAYPSSAAGRKSSC